MGSNQNPIHRDRDKRRTGGEAYEDVKQTFTEKEAEIERNAPFPEDEGAGLTDEQRDELQKQAASERLAKVQHEVENENNAG